MESMDNSLHDDIKYNCDVSDAKYWGYFSICGLLLRYRDLYRSEKKLKPWADIGREDIAAWISTKEARWPELEQKKFRDLMINGKSYHPFDVAGINLALKPHMLVYGAGYGMYMKPTFFLAELKSTKEISGLTVRTSGAELVRDLFTAPAMLQETSVYVRLEPLLILLHYKLSELNVKRNSVVEDAFAHYGFQHRQITEDNFEKRLEGLTARYAEIILYHEIAEFKEDVPIWKDVLSAAGDRRNELYLRAVKDLMADTSDHGPFKRIIDTRDRGALGLAIALMEGFRKVLFPEMKEAYAAFIRDGQWEIIETARRAGYKRLKKSRDEVLHAYETSGDAKNFVSAVRMILSKEM